MHRFPVRQTIEEKLHKRSEALSVSGATSAENQQSPVQQSRRVKHVPSSGLTESTEEGEYSELSVGEFFELFDEVPNLDDSLAFDGTDAPSTRPTQDLLP